MISVIIPAYNVEKYIIECLKSLEYQTFKNFEVIIVNDGSKDNTVEVINRYVASSGMKIRLLTQHNQGVSTARNLGIKEAKGKYLCFVDGDDMVDIHYLDKMMQAIITKKVDLVICKSIEVAQDTLYTHTQHLKGLSPSKNSAKVMKNYEVLKAYLYGQFTSGACTLLVSKQFILNNNLLFREGFKYSEDLHFVWRILANSNTVCILDNSFYFYRTRNNSAMSVIDNNRMDGLYLFIDLEKYFENKNPLFHKEFKQFSVSRWIWSTIWQICLSSDSLKKFNKSIEHFENYTEINFDSKMKNLLHFPNKKVKYSSRLYIISKSLYFFAIKLTVPFIYKRKIKIKD